MAWLKRSPVLPAELEKLLVGQGRLLAWAQHSGGFIAVTNKSLVNVDSHSTSITPWSESLQAKWEPPQLTIVFQGPNDLTPETRAWMLAEDSQLPRAVRDRVTAAVVLDRVYELPTAGKVRFVARKDENQAYWSALGDDLEASQSVAGQLEIAKAMAELRSTFGI